MTVIRAAFLGLAFATCLIALTQPTHSMTRAELDALVAAHAQANGVPVALVHRVIVRESRYNPRIIGKGGAMGLMQIKTATARGVGYHGSAAGLLDPATNLTYAVRYLGGGLSARRGQSRSRGFLLCTRLLLRREKPRTDGAGSGAAGNSILRVGATTCRPDNTGSGQAPRRLYHAGARPKARPPTVGCSPLPEQAGIQFRLGPVEIIEGTGSASAGGRACACQSITPESL
jgi:hypothetical protein